MERKILVALDATSIYQVVGRRCFQDSQGQGQQEGQQQPSLQISGMFHVSLFLFSLWQECPRRTWTWAEWEGIIRRKRGAVLSSVNTHLSSVNLSYRVSDRRLSLLTFPLQLFYFRQGRTIKIPGAKVWASLMAQAVKDLPVMQEIQETQVRSLGREDPLEKGMVTHSSILTWRIPWTEEPDGLQSMGSQRVRHGWACTQNEARTKV